MDSDTVTLVCPTCTAQGDERDDAPKVVECLGSDGRLYKQLAKSGNDDLRQDAVMEQLFDLVNSLLVCHRDTSSRSLRIRTYKVVPFTPSAGETNTRFGSSDGGIAHFKKK